jgi:hypothetical protein
MGREECGVKVVLRCFVVACAVWAAANWNERAGAAGAGVFLSGVVTADRRPVGGALVTAAGNNTVYKTSTDARGRFVFASLTVGTYVVTASARGMQAQASVDLANGGATVALALASVSQLGRVSIVGSQASHGSGSDTVLNKIALTHSPYSGSFTQALIQLPGAARGANGVVHLNGDHGVINYVLDGVAIPQALNREIGSEIDPNDVSFVDVLEGAYPAQYGLKFGSVLNISTRAQSGAAGFDGEMSYGSYNDLDTAWGYHQPLEGGGGLSTAIHLERSTRGLDPPDLDSPHNDASDANEFLRLTLPRGGNSFTDVTLINSFQTFQIPNDVNFGEPATTNDNETQADTFLNVQFRQSLGTTGSLSFGPAFKVSRVRDFGDPVNDWAYGEAINLTPPPFGNGGTPTDCANAVRTEVFSPTTCGFSLFDDKTALDYLFQSDYAKQDAKHELRAGVAYDLARVIKNYDVTLQPENFLSPIFTPGTPNAPYTVIDDNPNIGNTYGVYAQDSWTMSGLYALDYGMRWDLFTIKSTDFSRVFGALSPRMKLTRTFGQRASVYAYLGRFFEPFSLENVDPRAAQLLNLPLQPVLAQFDLKPERDTQLEIGGHLPLARGTLGFRAWQKNATDLIDDTQVGVTLLHQDINYAAGRLSQEALSYQQPLPSGRFYFNVARTLSLNAGCETQLLAPCFGSPTGFTPADHDQRWSVTAGWLRGDDRNGWFSADGEYGSGLSSAICPAGTPGYCKMTPHTIFSVEKGFTIGPRTALTLRIQNIFNDRYYVTILNAQGNHDAPPRQFDVGLRFGQ